MKKYVRIIVICFVITACNNTRENPGVDIAQAHQNGIELLKVAMQKHRDFYSDSIQISFAIDCNQYLHPTQSQTPFDPIVPGFLNRKIFIDPKSKLEIHKSELQAGTYIFRDVSVLQDNQRLSYNINTKTYEKNDFDFIRNLDLLPQTYLRKALENKTSIKVLSSYNPSENPAFLLEAFFDNTQHKLWLTQDTTLIKLENLRHSSTYGLGKRTYVFKDLRRINGCLLPSEIKLTYKNDVWNEVTNTFNLSSIDKERVVEFLEETPNYIEANHSYRKNAKVINLTTNIYLIENITSSSRFWSYNILFAELMDYVVVTEAPVSDGISDLVIKKIRETIPDKPIKFIVQSHHHSDHIAGIKLYIDQGITIVATPATSQVIQKVNQAYNYKERVDLVPKFQFVEESTEIGDDSLSIKVIDIGPTLHSEEMLVTYFPSEGILYQADMVNYGEWPIDNAISIELAKKIKEYNMSVNIIIGTHGRIMNKHEVDKFLKGTLENKFDK